MQNIKCVICNELFYEDVVPEIFICNSCRKDIELCNKLNSTMCSECYTITTRANINNSNNVKETVRYNCNKGNRLMKYVKKHDLKKCEISKLVKWGI